MRLESSDLEAMSLTVAAGQLTMRLADATSEQVETLIEDFTGYKSRNGAIWSRGELKVFRNLKLADNAIGFTHASGGVRFDYSSQVRDSLFVGQTENVIRPVFVTMHEAIA